MKSKTAFSYDSEEDILLLHKENEKSRGSLEIGDFIVDFSSDMKKAIGLEIMNASKMLGKFSPCISKEQLSSIKAASLKTENKGDVIYVYYTLLYMCKQKEETFNSFVPVPQPIKAF